MAIDFIYHGTDAKTARAALTNGLHPRGSSRGSKWGIASNPHMVYLTRQWAPYFAFNATERDEPIGIVEVDLARLDPENFYPDEDYIEQSGRGVLPQGTMKERTTWVRDNIKQFKPWAFRCLHRFGNIAYRGAIPAEAISRVAIVPLRACPVVMEAFLDLTVTVGNAAIMAPWYRLLTRILMRDPVTFEELVDWDGTISQMPPESPFITQRRRHAEALLDHREEWEVSVNAHAGAVGRLR